MKLKVVCRKLYDYVRYDLREIAFPSSLPDPPGYVPPPKLTYKECTWRFRRACRRYAASWRTVEIPAKKPEDGEDKTHQGKDQEELEIGPTVEDLAFAARGGMEKLRPVLQDFYMTKASAFAKTLQGFIEGYQEGIRQTLEEHEAKSRKENDKTNNSA